MKKSKLSFKSRIAFIMVGLICLGTAINLGVKKYKQKQALRALKHDAIVKIENTQDGSYCTATIVSDEIALTANHCVDITSNELNPLLIQYNRARFLLNRLEMKLKLGIELNFTEQQIYQKIRQYLINTSVPKVSTYIIKNAKGEETKVVATAVKRYDRRDIALLKGDFKDFHKLKVKTRSQGMFPEKKYTICGYAEGTSPYICVKFIAKKPLFFGYVGEGQVFGGMSGGPVLDSKGNVVGVIYGMKDSYASISPILGIF